MLKIGIVGNNTSKEEDNPLCLKHHETSADIITNIASSWHPTAKSSVPRSVNLEHYDKIFKNNINVWVEMGKMKKEHEHYCKCFYPGCASTSRDKNSKWHKVPKNPTFTKYKRQKKVERYHVRKKTLFALLDKSGKNPVTLRFIDGAANTILMNHLKVM